MSSHGIGGPRDQSSPNLGNKCQLPRPLTLPYFIALGQTMYEKSVTDSFTTFSILVPQEDPLGQSSPTLTLMYSKAKTKNTPNFIPFWHRSAAKIGWFRSKRDRQTWLTKNSKRLCFRVPSGDSNFMNVMLSYTAFRIGMEKHTVVTCFSCTLPRRMVTFKWQSFC